MNIVDLFSGAGGLTFGFYYKIRDNQFVRNRENNILFANAYDAQAAQAFHENFNNIPLSNRQNLDEHDSRIQLLVEIVKKIVSSLISKQTDLANTINQAQKDLLNKQNDNAKNNLQKKSNKKYTKYNDKSLKCGKKG